MADDLYQSTQGTEVPYIGPESSHKVWLAPTPRVSLNRPYATGTILVDAGVLGQSTAIIRNTIFVPDDTPTPVIPSEPVSAEVKKKKKKNKSEPDSAPAPAQTEAPVSKPIMLFSDEVFRLLGKFSEHTQPEIIRAARDAMESVIEANDVYQPEKQLYEDAYHWDACDLVLKQNRSALEMKALEEAMRKHDSLRTLNPAMFIQVRDSIINAYAALQNFVPSSTSNRQAFLDNHGAANTCGLHQRRQEASREL